MKIIICGAGRVGQNTARYLAKEKHEVTVIDNNNNLLTKLSNNLEVKTVYGCASYPTTLQKAEAKNADMIIALTDNDEVNMIICQIAYAKFGIKKRIARIRQSEYLDKNFQKDFYKNENMPIGTIVSPEKEIVKSITNIMNVPQSFDHITLSNSLINVVGVLCKEDCPLLGVPLKKLTAQYPKINMQIVAIIRDKNIIFPKGDMSLQKDDEVYFCVKYTDIKKAMESFGYTKVKNHKALIVGGGEIGFELAKEIEKHFKCVSVKIVEKDKNRANFLANNLKKTKIINGSAKKEEILQEANIEKFDSIITLTQEDEANILISLLGKKMGAKLAISLIKNEFYHSLAKNIGVDSIISLNSIIVSKILKETKTAKIKSVHSIRGNFAEIVEAKVKSGAKITQEKIKELGLPDTVRIGAIVKSNNKVIIPGGSDRIAIGDTVILVSAPQTMEYVEKLFKV